MLNLAHLVRVPQVDPLFDISPADSKIAFAWNKTGEWQIYETRFASLPGRGAGRRAEPVEAGESDFVQLTSGMGGKFNPRYSPDGSRLAYVLDVDGSERYHLVVYDYTTNQHTDLTANIRHALQPNFCWSPDGSQLAFLSNEQGHFSAYVMPSIGGKAQLILDTGHPAWQVEWSPDGNHLAICNEMHGQDYGIFVVELSHEGQRRAFDVKEEIPLNAHAPQWSSNGKQLAFHADSLRWFDIGMYDLRSKEITWMITDEGDSQSPIFMSNGGQSKSIPRLAYTQSKGALNWIATALDPVRKEHAGLPGQQPREGSRKKFAIGKGIHNGIRFTSDVKRMVTTFSAPSRPSDLWMMDIESGEAIQLTNSMPDDLSKDKFVMPEEIIYEGMDGVEIPALLYRPIKIPAPAVVMIHGGPNWHYSAEWNPVMAHFASRGCVVLCPNYRGSTGYGREWQYAARFDLGGVDTRDVAAGAQFLVREGLAIENKIAVTGRSHGGYLTMTCLTQYPELWCAGSAVVPFMNWFKSHDDSREDLQHWNIENMGEPKGNYERWHNASPYFFLNRINAPVQLICGGNDPRCPASDSLEARDKLVELGKEVELLLYEDEGHAFLKIGNVLDAELKRVEFLQRHLDG